MSRTTETLVENPCKNFLKWKTVKEEKELEGQTVKIIKGGAWEYYNKETEEKKLIDLHEFAILNPSLVCFKGYDEKKEKGIWSNEVSKPEHLVTLRSDEGVLKKFNLGDYKANKDAINGLGAKWTQSVYIAVKVDGQFEIWNLQLVGGALTGGNDAKADKKKKEEEKYDGWFNFSNFFKNKLYTNFISVKDFKKKIKGENTFTIPVYTIGEAISPDEGKQLDELDKQLKEYLTAYFNKNAEELVENQ